jgi:tetratricopeptide (TPR) repeat protein
VYYGNQFQLDLAEQYVQKAYDLRERVSERERLYISEKYFTYLTGEMDKRIEILQTWAHLYPNDYIPHNNLALNYNIFGRYDEGVKEALEAVRLSPTGISPRDNLIASFNGLNRLDEAEQVVKEMAAQHPDAASSHFNRFYFAAMRGDQSQIDAEVQWARGKPAEADLTDQLAALAFSVGKEKKGEDLKRRAVELYKNQDRKENASQVLIGLAANQASFGKCEQAKENVAAGLALYRGRISVPFSALVFAVCNDMGRAQSSLDEALKQYPKDTMIVSMQAPLIKAALERNQGNARQALELLESVHAYDLGLIGGLGNNYLRGQSYLDQRSGNEAAAEFQKIIDHPGIEGFSPLHALAHLGLARAAALNGDTAGSRKEYQDFFALWKDADADLPVLVQAKKEYEQLK